jgi:hypothetical protein
LCTSLPLARQIQEVALARNPFAIHHVELRLPKRWGDLVLHHLHPHPAAGRLVAVFDLADAPHIQADGGVKLQRITAGGGFGVAHKHADLLSELVDEDHRRLGLADDAGELAQGLGHEPRLHTHWGIAHLAVDLGLGDQGRHGIHHNDIDGTAAHEGLGGCCQINPS